MALLTISSTPPTTSIVSPTLTVTFLPGLWLVQGTGPEECESVYRVACYMRDVPDHKRCVLDPDCDIPSSLRDGADHS